MSNRHGGNKKNNRRYNGGNNNRKRQGSKNLKPKSNFSNPTRWVTKFTRHSSHDETGSLLRRWGADQFLAYLHNVIDPDKMANFETRLQRRLEHQTFTELSTVSSAREAHTLLRAVTATAREWIEVHKLYGDVTGCSQGHQVVSRMINRLLESGNSGSLPSAQQRNAVGVTVPRLTEIQWYLSFFLVSVTSSRISPELDRELGTEMETHGAFDCPEAFWLHYGDILMRRVGRFPQPVLSTENVMSQFVTDIQPLLSEQREHEIPRLFNRMYRRRVNCNDAMLQQMARRGAVRMDHFFLNRVIPPVPQGQDAAPAGTNANPPHPAHHGQAVAPGVLAPHYQPWCENTDALPPLQMEPFIPNEACREEFFTAAYLEIYTILRDQQRQLVTRELIDEGVISGSTLDQLVGRSAGLSAVPRLEKPFPGVNGGHADQLNAFCNAPHPYFLRDLPENLGTGVLRSLASDLRKYKQRRGGNRNRRDANPHRDGGDQKRQRRNNQGPNYTSTQKKGPQKTSAPRKSSDKDASNTANDYPQKSGGSRSTNNRGSKGPKRYCQLCAKDRPRNQHTHNSKDCRFSPSQ